MTDAHEIAEQLGETRPQPIALIARILRRLGHVQTWALVERVREIEAAGGMLTSDGARRRTPGGVFFALVKQHVKASGQTDVEAALFPPRRRQRQRRGHPAHPPYLPPLRLGLRPRVKGRPGAPPPPRMVAGASPPDPGTAALDSNSALAAARRLLTAEIGCYAVGAHEATRTLRVRISFPDAARARYAGQIAALERESGWRVELRP
ncbi:MAG TPA: phosphorylated adapter RNA export RNA-binding domain-containing protein, partial [Roseiflexaceae bacterium]|nr:phosphorylated adapter RNA export RNA-binding domain-containing protein [Roseiflexaceae bacterium]